MALLGYLVRLLAGVTGKCPGGCDGAFEVFLLGFAACGSLGLTMLAAWKAPLLFLLDFAAFLGIAELVVDCISVLLALFVGVLGCWGLDCVAVGDVGGSTDGHV